MSNIMFISGSPTDIISLEKTLTTFEKVNGVGYSRKEKLNACGYVFYFEGDARPDPDFIEILTKRYCELFATIVRESSATMISQGLRIVYPKP
jgi:hypothetical protein